MQHTVGAELCELIKLVSQPVHLDATRAKLDMYSSLSSRLILILLTPLDLFQHSAGQLWQISWSQLFNMILKSWILYIIVHWIESIVLITIENRKMVTLINNKRQISFYQSAAQSSITFFSGLCICLKKPSCVVSRIRAWILYSQWDLAGLSTTAFQQSCTVLHSKDAPMGFDNSGDTAQRFRNAHATFCLSRYYDCGKAQKKTDIELWLIA